MKKKNELMKYFEKQEKVKKEQIKEKEKELSKIGEELQYFNNYRSKQWLKNDFLQINIKKWIIGNNTFPCLSYNKIFKFHIIDFHEFLSIEFNKKSYE